MLNQPWSLPTMMVISGGQTGVDRGALLAARRLGHRYGGWCPKGRLAEDGTIPLDFVMTECISDRYEDRTRLNVECADATLILTYENHSRLTGGTKLTESIVLEHKQPLFVLELDRQNGAFDQDKLVAKHIREWLRCHQPRTLNVAGPRESKAPGIQVHSARIVGLILQTRAKCLCGRVIPPQVWDQPRVANGEQPVQCSVCFHSTHVSDFA